MIRGHLFHCSDSHSAEARQLRWQKMFVFNVWRKYKFRKGIFWLKKYINKWIIKKINPNRPSLKLNKFRGAAYVKLSEQVKEEGRLKWLIGSSPKITFPLSRPKKWQIIFTPLPFKLPNLELPNHLPKLRTLFRYFNSVVFRSPINQTVTSLGRDWGANCRE